MKKLNLILLVDDNDADNEFHEIVIRNANITSHLTTINDSREALEYFQKELVKVDNQAKIPELMFLDINMPAMTGFELLDELRQIPDPNNYRKRMKVYMLTGSLNPDDYNTAMEKYSDLISGFRIKPLTDTIFLEIVQKNF